MAAAVQAKSVGDDFHVTKTMPSIKTTILHKTNKIQKDLSPRSSDDERELRLKALGVDKDVLSPSSDQGYRPIIKLSRSGHRGTSLHPASPSGVSEEYVAMAKACSHDHDYSGPLEIISPRSFATRDNHIRHAVPQIVKRDPDERIGLSGSNTNKEIMRTPRAPIQHRGRRILLVRNTTSAEVPIKDRQISKKQADTSVSKLPDNSTRSDTSSTQKKECDSKDDSQRKADVIPQILKDSKGGSEFEKGLDTDITSPRPSITPFPPTERRRFRQSTEPGFKRIECIPNSGKEANGDAKAEGNKEDDCCKTSVDSAYSSLTYSSSSMPRTPSGNRPPSGGKRGATCGLTSSSSSGTSSDEWSDVESSQRTKSSGKSDNAEIHKESREYFETTIVDDELFSGDDQSRTETRPAENSQTHQSRPQRKITSGKKIRKQSRQLESTQQTTVTTEKVQFVPTPPARKPKKSKYYRSVPMRLRALPTSFWEEPNRTNASPYTVLPPVQPLFHQQDNEDITNIRPVTPPNDKESSVNTSRQAMSTAGCDRPRHRPIIRTGDTDLLWRLFDKVEKNQNQTGIRAKRGRPKRPTYCAMPPPRRALNDNPCIINSITEKLFPKLTLDHRHPIAAMVTSSALTGRQTADIVTDESNSKAGGIGSKFSVMAGEAGLNSNVFLSDDDSPSSSAAFGPDVAMDMTSSSPSPTYQARPPQISLPQLVMQKEYSQLLNELAAVL